MRNGCNKFSNCAGEIQGAAALHHRFGGGICGRIGVLLRPANRLDNPWSGRSLAQLSGAVRRLSEFYFNRRHSHRLLDMVSNSAVSRETQAWQSRESAGRCRDDIAVNSLVRAVMGTAGVQRALEYLGRYAMKDKLLATGIIGTIIAAICCFTPILVLLLGTVGLSAMIGYLDMVLLPALAICLLIVGYALWRRQRIQ